MKYIATILFLCFSFIIKAQQPVDETWPGKLIEGTWKMITKNGSIIGESWKKMDDNYYQSTGFIIKEKDTVFTEKVALKRSVDAVFYTSTVEDQNNGQPVSFRLTSSNNNIFVFETRRMIFQKGLYMNLVITKHCMPILMTDPKEKNEPIFIIKKKNEILCKRSGTNFRKNTNCDAFSTIGH
jgi:hypothetical protein